jgi:bla regulator protein blaR1
MRPSFVASIALLVLQAFGQPSVPSFGAASVKPSKVNTESSSWNSRPGYLVMKNQTLITCIQIAYALKADQVAGGPKWIDSDRFDIEARAAGPAKDPELLAMLRALVAERFQLKLHRGSKLVDGYAMVIAKNGLRIREAEGSGPQRMNWTRGRLTAERASMPKLAETLARMTGMPVVDITGVPGEFSYKLEWNPEADQAAAIPGATIGRPVPISETLFPVLQQELGIRLEHRKAPIDVLTIDKAEKPSEN